MNQLAFIRRSSVLPALRLIAIASLLHGSPAHGSDTNGSQVSASLASHSQSHGSIVSAPPLVALPNNVLKSSMAARAEPAIDGLPTEDGREAESMAIVDGRFVACRAAQQWPPAQALRARGETIRAAYAGERPSAQRAARCLASFLNQHASYQEDIGAASALRAYYGRIAVQEQLQLSVESRELVAREQSKQEVALEKGLATGVDPSGFERRILEIEDQQLQLRNQDRQLRSLLVQLACLDYDASSVQQEQLDVRVTEIDCARLQLLALQSRCDFRGWQSLAAHASEDSVPLIGQLLSTTEGGFGLPLPAIGGLKSLLCLSNLSSVADSLQRELQATVEAQRRWICQTVEERCHNLQLAYRRSELARAMVESWQRRLDQLQQLESLGQRAAEEQAAARLGLLTSRSEEIARRLEARSAEIDLAESVGGLARRCCMGQAWLP